MNSDGPFPTSTPCPREPPLHFLYLWISLRQVLDLMGIIQYLSFCIWLISLTLMPSRFVGVISYCQDFTPFPGWRIFRCVYLSHICLSIHPSVGSGCFSLLAIVNKAAMNTDVQIFLQVPTFSSSGFRAKRRTAGSWDNSVFSFWRNCHMDLTVWFRFFLSFLPFLPFLLFTPNALLFCWDAYKYWKSPSPGPSSHGLVVGREVGLVLRHEGLRPDSWWPGLLFSISFSLPRLKGGQADLGVLSLCCLLSCSSSSGSWLSSPPSLLETQPVQNPSSRLSHSLPFSSSLRMSELCPSGSKEGMSGRERAGLGGWQAVYRGLETQAGAAVMISLMGSKPVPCIAKAALCARLGPAIITHRPGPKGSFTQSQNSPFPILGSTKLKRFLQRHLL